MCGIVGSVSKNHVDISAMLESITHRGPDGHGIHSDVSSKNNYNINFGHKRLSIIDLSLNAKQPFISQFNNYCVITFNGEIYNYRELALKYLKEFNFKSTSDTEIIIELYKKYGENSFKWLKGMFAFAIYDKLKDEIFLVRDGLGIKPLYYYFSDNSLYFSSEIKGLKVNKDIKFNICKNSVVEFFLNGFIYEPNTGYKNIFKVYPGTYIKVSLYKELLLKEVTFWSPSSFLEKKRTVKNDISNLLKKAYNEHLVSDVKIGLFYSGGVDSSSLLLMSDKNISSYLICNKNDNKDLFYAKKIANHINKKFEIVEMDSLLSDQEKIIDSIKNVAINSEELIADYTFAASHQISKIASKKGYKVMLSGMGGDEIFLGYPRYKLIYYHKFYWILNLIMDVFSYKPKFLSKKIDRLKSYFKSKPFVLKYTNLVGYFQESELDKFILDYEPYRLNKYITKLNNILKPYIHLHKVKQAQILDLYGFLSHNFMVADKSSMLCGVEIRVPLATTDIFEETLNIRVREFISLFHQKIPLVKYLKKSIPLKFFNRPKQGFNPDLDVIIEKLGKNKIFEILNNKKFCSVISLKYAKKLIDDHFNSVKNNSYKIYQLIYFNYWIKYNME